MSIDPPFSTGSVGPISGVGAAQGGGPGGLQESLRSLALDVVGQIADALQLTGSATPQGQGDIYGIAALADGIASAFPDSSAADAGALTRALEDFASAVATDMAAYADGRTLDLAGDALAAAPLSDASGITDAIRGIEQATAQLDAARH